MAFPMEAHAIHSDKDRIKTSVHRIPRPAKARLRHESTRAPLADPRRPFSKGVLQKVARPATFPASTGKFCENTLQLSNNKAEAPGWSFRLCMWKVLFLICPVRTCLWDKGLPTIRVRLSANKPSKQRWHSAKPGACCGWLRHGFRRSHECSSHACQGCAKP